MPVTEFAVAVQSAIKPWLPQAIPSILPSTAQSLIAHPEPACIPQDSLKEALQDLMAQLLPVTIPSKKLLTAQESTRQFPPTLMANPLRRPVSLNRAQ